MELEGEKERVAVVRKRACCEFLFNDCGKVCDGFYRRKWWKCRGMRVRIGGEVIVRVLASVPSVLIPNSFVDLVCDWDLSVSHIEVSESQTLSEKKKRHSENEQRKKRKPSRERQPFKAVPGQVRNRPTPQSAPYKSVRECVSNRAPPPPEGTPLQERPTWLGPPLSKAERNRTMSLMLITPDITDPPHWTAMCPGHWQR